MAKCPACGAETLPDIAYCIQCGQPLRGAPSTATNRREEKIETAPVARPEPAPAPPTPTVFNPPAPDMAEPKREGLQSAPRPPTIQESENAPQPQSAVQGPPPAPSVTPITEPASLAVPQKQEIAAPARDPASTKATDLPAQPPSVPVETEELPARKSELLHQLAASAPESAPVKTELPGIQKAEPQTSQASAPVPEPHPISNQQSPVPQHHPEQEPEVYRLKPRKRTGPKWGLICALLVAFAAVGAGGWYIGFSGQGKSGATAPATTPAAPRFTSTAAGGGPPPSQPSASTSATAQTPTTPPGPQPGDVKDFSITTSQITADGQLQLGVQLEADDIQKVSIRDEDDNSVYEDPDTQTRNVQTVLDIKVTRSGRLYLTAIDALGDKLMRTVALPMDSVIELALLLRSQTIVDLLTNAPSVDTKASSRASELFYGLSLNDLRMLYNAPFAFYGYDFHTKGMPDYYGRFPWYHPTTPDSDAIFHQQMTATEQANTKGLTGLYKYLKKERNLPDDTSLGSLDKDMILDQLKSAISAPTP